MSGHTDVSAAKSANNKPAAASTTALPDWFTTCLPDGCKVHIYICIYLKAILLVLATSVPCILYNSIPEVSRRLPDAARRLPDAARKLPDAARKLSDSARRAPDAAARLPEAPEGGSSSIVNGSPRFYGDLRSARPGCLATDESLTAHAQDADCIVSPS